MLKMHYDAPPDPPSRLGGEYPLSRPQLLSASILASSVLGALILALVALVFQPKPHHFLKPSSTHNHSSDTEMV